MRKTALLITLMAFGHISLAADEETLRAAKMLHEISMSVDTPELVDTIMKAMVSASPADTPKEVFDVMRSSLLEIIRSEEYAAAKTRVYAANFSKDELLSLTSLIKDPVFVKYRQLLPKITAESAAEANALMQAHRPEIEKRLQEAWNKADAR